MAGRIDVESAAGDGSVFTVVLPMGEMPDPAARADAAVSAGRSL